MNPGILTSGYRSPPLPYGLLGNPTPVLMPGNYLGANNNFAVDSDARAYIDAVRNADGGQFLEAGVQRAIDDFVFACKADGIWSAIRASCILMGARTLAGALVPLVGAAPTNVNFVGGDYDRKAGLVGNAATKSLDSNRANGADPQNDNHNAVYVSNVGTVNGCYIGSASTTDAGSNACLGGSANTFFSRNRSATGTAAASVPLAGLLGHGRSAASLYFTRFNGANSTVSVASGTPFAANVLLFRRAALAPNFHNCRMAFYSIGSALDLALLDARVTALYNAIGAAIP